MQASRTNIPTIEVPKVNFLWLELTNNCNLECVHCYADSKPGAGKHDTMTTGDYLSVIRDARANGCEQIQFIGGEATLHKDLPAFIELAAEAGYTFIEVFTNLVSLSDRLISLFKEYDVQLAASMYSFNPATHDAITQRRGSWQKTVMNLKRVLKAGIPCRVGLVEMDENTHEIRQTLEFLEEMGLSNVKVDNVRGFGRGARESDDHEMSSLCGHCSEDVLCVGPDGKMSPCIMSRKWSVGNVKSASFSEVVSGAELTSLREQIAEAVNSQPRMGSCNPDCSPVRCGPYHSCNPRNCHPRR